MRMISAPYNSLTPWSVTRAGVLSNLRWAGPVAILALVASLFSTPATASDMLAPLPPPRPSEWKSPPTDWKFQLTLYGWATSLSGDVGIRNLPTTSIDMPFSQVLRDLDGALMGSFFAQNGEWLILADIVFAKLSASRSTEAFGGSNLSASITETIASGAVGHMVPTGRSDFDFAITGGLRYASLKASLSLGSTLPLPDPSASARQWWIDPTVGFFAHWDVNDKWFVNSIADIGGFGIGSKLSSTGYVGIGYMWNDSISTSVGYRYLYEDYEGPGAKTGTFRYNSVMHGPTVAVSWRF